MITSTSNSQIRHVAMLQKKARYRNSEGQFVAEGIKMVLETPPELLSRIYVSEDFQPEKQVRAWLSDKSCEVVSSKVFKELSMTQTPQGILAVVHMSRPTPEEILSSGDCFLILENLQDPGNLGTILRTAEALGVSRVILLGDCCDPLSPKALRASMGAVFRLELGWEPSGERLCARLREQGLELLASVPDSAALPITQVDFSRGRYAIFIGNEGNGLTRQTISQCRQVTIPMKGRAESLNASAAATILLWELARAEEKEGFCG